MLAFVAEVLPEIKLATRIWVTLYAKTSNSM